MVLRTGTSLPKAAVSNCQTGLIGASAIAMTLGLYEIEWPPNAIVTDDDCFDFIIIGSGSGGVVANRLTENSSINVLMIEAGKPPSVESMLPGAFAILQNTYQDWNFKSEREPASQSQSGDVFKISAGKTLGGSSQINHLIYLRGDPTDFDSWAEKLNDSSWNYESVLPYFLKAETMKDEEIMTSEYAEFHNSTGPITLTRELYEESENYLTSFEEAGQEQKIDLNAAKTCGYAQSTLSIDEVRHGISQAYIRPIAKRENLKVMYESIATKINFDDEMNAVSVDLLVDGKIITVNACKEIILSAGAINSPKLLMLSGIGPKDHLESFDIKVLNDLPVGQNLQDHYGVLIVQKMERSLDVPSEVPGVTTVGFPIIMGAARIDQTVEYPQYQTTNAVFPHDSPFLLIICAEIFGYKNEICEELINDCVGRNTLNTFVGVIDGKSRGNVTLNSKDPLDQPISRLGYYSDSSDEDAIVKYIEDFLKVQDTTYFRSVNSAPVNLAFDDCEGDFTCEDYRRCYVRHMTSTLLHYSGTCSMGSVVDSELNVIGVKRLRVVDASIMPTIPRANTFAATVMIAEKASDMIKADRKTKESMTTDEK